MSDTQMLRKRSGRDQETQDIVTDMRQLVAVPEASRKSDAIRHLEEDVKVRICALMFAAATSPDLTDAERTAEIAVHHEALAKAVGGEDKLQDFVLIR